MAININTGFHLGAALPIDDRAYLTKAQMLAVNENIYPDYFLTVCADDGFVYMFDKNMEDEKISAETGKFKLFAGDVEEAIAILNGDVDTEGSVLHSIKFNAANALVHPEEIITYTVSAAEHDDVVLTAEEKAAVDAGTAYSVDDTWQIEKVAEGYKFVDKNGVEASVDAAVTETKTTPTTTIAEAIEELAESAEVTLKAYSTEAEGVTEGYLKTYEIFQGEESVGKIDIPKDLVVTEGSVIEITAIEPVEPETEITYKVGDETYKAADVADEESKWYGYPTAAGTFIKLIVANQKLPIFIDAKDLVDTGSLGKTTEDITANVECGGIANGATVPKGSDLEAFVKQLLTKYYAPVVSLSGSVSNKIQRKGTTLSNVEFTAVVTKKSEKITSVEVNGVAQTDVENGGTFKETVATIDNTTTVSATATDGKTPVTKSVTYTFVLPYMHGVSSKATIDSDTDLTSLTEVVETEGKKTFVYTAANQYIVFVMPKEYAALASIIDQNGFDNTDSFTVGTYTNAAGEEYRTYISKVSATCSGFKYDFN